jgi:hypothetical protein
MSSPRHLWSGDWELDSTAAREELARRRAAMDEAVGTPPVEPSPPAPPPLSARALALLRAARGQGREARQRLAAALGWKKGDMRIALLVTLATLLTAAVAFGVSTLVAQSGNSSTVANNGPPWLGIDVVGSPLGIMVANVAPGSPAEVAGLEPGDIITAIGSQPVSTVDDVGADLGRLHAGDEVQIHFTRALVSYSVQAKLGSPRPGSP